MIEPQCCAELGDANNWVEAAAYRGAEWQMLWIGHPWLWVAYQSPWLILRNQNESDAAADRWAIRPAELALSCG